MTPENNLPKKRTIKIKITQRMCNELNNLQDELFTQEQQKVLGMKRHVPCELEALYG